MYYLKAYLLKDLEKKRLKPSDHGILLIHHVAWPWNRKNIGVPSCPYKTAFYCYNTFWAEQNNFDCHILRLTCSDLSAANFIINPAPLS